MAILYTTRHKGCPESIQPFWISQEPVMWPWCNLSASKGRTNCASMNSHSPMGLVSSSETQLNELVYCVTFVFTSLCTVWLSYSRACVLCDCHIHNDQANRQACPFYSSCAGFFGKASHHPGLSGTYSPDLAPCDFWLFPKLKSPLKGRRCVNVMVTQYTIQSMVSHCWPTSPTGEWLFIDAH
jgi:hypothetical protein